MIMSFTIVLQDMTRTGSYHAAIIENTADFDGNIVMDVGAGSGILSLFAAQASGLFIYLSVIFIIYSDVDTNLRALNC